YPIHPLVRDRTNHNHMVCPISSKWDEIPSFSLFLSFFASKKCLELQLRIGIPVVGKSHPSVVNDGGHDHTVDERYEESLGIKTYNKTHNPRQECSRIDLHGRETVFCCVIFPVFREEPVIRDYGHRNRSHQPGQKLKEEIEQLIRTIPGEK